ncbi:hypothetical protein BTZ20_0741 [Rhodococcus sp. MTM3W5.2]|nr:hypothetical protein BTZ20_0741 [Rhodococcus sp. MTM3W5.2]
MLKLLHGNDFRANLLLMCFLISTRSPQWRQAQSRVGRGRRRIRRPIVPQRAERIHANPLGDYDGQKLWAAS